MDIRQVVIATGYHMQPHIRKQFKEPRADRDWTERVSISPWQKDRFYNPTQFICEIRRE